MVDDPNRPNNNDSFIDEDDFLAAERMDDASHADKGGKLDFKEIWQQNASLKIFAIVAGLAIFLIAFMVFGSDDKPAENSIVRQTADVSQPPGTAELSPAYEDAVRQSNTQIAENAVATGGSAIPTPIARPSERIEAPVQIEQNDPLSEWRREAEARRQERQKEQEEKEAQVELEQQNQAPSLPEVKQPEPSFAPQQQQVAQNPPLPTAPTPDMINTIAQQMNQQMSSILETQIPKESIVVSMNIQPGYDIKKYFPPAEENAARTSTTSSSATAATQNNAIAQPKPIVQAGTIAYAQILTQANSDVPGPVLAEIASGPLTGGRAIGQFQVAQRHLVLQFNRIMKDGVEYTVQAYALDPGTTLPAVVTNIDNHYFSRVFLPAASRFIQGFAQAAVQQDQSVVVVGDSVVTNSQNKLNTRQQVLQGANEGAREVSQILERNADRPITISVAAGTRIGFLFVSSVFDPNAMQNQIPQNGMYPGQQQGSSSFANYAGQAYGAYNAYQQQQQNPYGTQQYQGSGNLNYMTTPQTRPVSLQ